MKRRIGAINRISCVAVCLLSFIGVQADASAADSAPELCHRAELERPLSWISSAVWLEHGSEIIVVDPFQDHLLAFLPSGQLAREIPRRNRAFAILPIKNEHTNRWEYLQIAGETTVHWLDDQFHKKKNGDVDLSPSNADSPYQVGSQYDMAVARNRIVAYGTIQKRGAGDHEFWYGFYSQGIPPPERDEKPLVEEFILYAPGGSDFFLLGHPYLCASGRFVYFIAMDGSPKLYRYDTEAGGDAQLLRGLPGEDVPLEDFSFARYNNDVEAFQDIERFRVPAGLYSQDDLLYLLHREPKAAHTAWSLFQLQPGETAVRVLGKVRLPTRAHHLTVLPTPRFWAIFEKGAVTSDGKQQITTMLILPKSWVKDPTSSPLAAPGGESLGCRDHLAGAP